MRHHRAVGEPLTAHQHCLTGGHVDAVGKCVAPCCAFVEVEQLRLAILDLREGEVGVVAGIVKASHLVAFELQGGFERL